MLPRLHPDGSVGYSPLVVCKGLLSPPQPSDRLTKHSCVRTATSTPGFPQSACELGEGICKPGCEVTAHAMKFQAVTVHVPAGEAGSWYASSDLNAAGNNGSSLPQPASESNYLFPKPLFFNLHTSIFLNHANEPLLNHPKPSLLEYSKLTLC